MPVAQPLAKDTATASYGNFDTHFFHGQDEVSKDGTLRLNSKVREEAKFTPFLPEWDPKHKLDPLVFHKYEDPALRADPAFPNLLPDFSPAEASVKKITPRLGTQIDGIQLSSLSNAGKDELALLVAQRGVVIFRNQDFAQHGPQYAVDYGKHFGKLHVHQTSGAPKGHPELHITFRRPDRKEFNRVFHDNTSSIAFHTDVSYELQPPSYTFFSVLDGPEAGGDTLFSDSVTAFERLSPAFQDFLSTLHVVHSSKEQAANSQGQGGIQRRAPVTHIHPLVRYHPVLKKKTLYVNSSFSRRIVELKRPESDNLLQFLYRLTNDAQDLQLRANWGPGSVVIWDNRRVNHSAVIDWEEPILRHAFRITPQGERPVEDPKYLNDPTYYPSSLTEDV
ncbi:LANO_0G01706g1_1 [Lachancea nothofagi CBS 11611]|uniref:LANO_0G01706g1_1 n=1 Tax=Lachancea nothofagi CBS 11611 TaxID=1266666 RepID=A0A1G4KEP6_9SACH|nr:LANO_0G01706g1_1 [Lachancea nothofagi CBS 11611]